MPNDIKTNQPIYAGAPSVGLRNVGSYQVSGEPWISGSDAHPASQTRRYKFPFVTREVAVTNMGAQAGGNYFKVHFVSGSTLHTTGAVNTGDFAATHRIPYDGKKDVFQGSHYVTLSGSQSITFKAKVKEIYISTNADVGAVVAGDLSEGNDLGSGTEVGAAADVVHYRIIADLTNVPTRRMYVLTGSGHTEMASNEI